MKKEVKLMNTVYFVIGAVAAGKTYFIEHNFKDKDADFIDIYNYQQKIYDSRECGDEFKCLYKANNLLLDDILKSLQQGRDVVVEQTFYKAKRRIAYIDEIRKEFVDVKLEVYVLSPSEDRWNRNIKSRQLENIDGIKSLRNQIEFPNPIEGFDKIYRVTDDGIYLKMEIPKTEIVENARKELAEETQRIKEDNERQEKHRLLLESMNTRPFWHYCEVCGKKEYISADEAYNTGWKYPPKIGTFGLLGPRTCGQCSITSTLYGRFHQSKSTPIYAIMPSMLEYDDLLTWMRIKTEPESLLEQEKTDNWI